MTLATYDGKAINEGFTRDGYVRLPALIDPAGVTSIMTELDRYVREIVPTMPNTEVYYEELGNGSTLKQMQKLHVYDPFFAELFLDGPIRELAATLLGDEAVPINLQYFNKPPRVGQPTPPHQDGYYFMLEPCEAVTMWLALDHVDEENGCVRYIPGSHAEGLRSHGRTKTLGFSQGIVDYGTDADRARETPVPAHPGDLLAHHAMMIHRADGNRSSERNRRALGLVYFAGRAKEDKAARAAYQKKLNEELAAGRKI